MFGIGAALGPIAGVALWATLGNPVWVLFGVTSVLALVPGWYGINTRREPANVASD